MDNKLTYAMFAVVLVVALGAYFFPGAKNATEMISGTASPVGSTYNSGSFTGATLNLATVGTNGTTTSILNNTSQDRYVTGVRLACSGIGSSNQVQGGGLAALSFSAGTTTIPIPAASSTAALIGSWTNLVNLFTIPTSTPTFVMASGTTALATSTLAGFWPSGTYESFLFNATNTATCTVGVDYISN